MPGISPRRIKRISLHYYSATRPKHSSHLMLVSSFLGTRFQVKPITKGACSVKVFTIRFDP
jgi:hypothetical protein